MREGSGLSTTVGAHRMREGSGLSMAVGAHRMREGAGLSMTVGAHRMRDNVLQKSRMRCAPTVLFGIRGGLIRAAVMP